ncbi:hypothetical protein [Halalkalicoccus sp. NIPERK01]|uniref:hypothetical protein n=1 Tax=Halalkalicoccus sp. NIPERK01 TaxID=3053469 RepID=UPI00256EBB07|nr:hypothetical protein [Halalkalicoccus sp. NIPERK01]MDL5362542.1 hypothetical protein [Halalkalicoccus sp. NIPERK01]
MHLQDVSSRITHRPTIRSEQDFQRELCYLISAAARNDVEISPISVWVCHYEDRPDQEVQISEIAE